jgi:hypothetical protein
MAYKLTVTRRMEFPDGRVIDLDPHTITGRGTPELARASRLNRYRVAGTTHRTRGGVIEARHPGWLGEPCTEVTRLEWSDPDQPSIEQDH